jgi:SAM-dependent methyltransferase
MLSRVKRVARDLGVRWNLIPYRRPWVLDAQDWDREYQSGKLDYYSNFKERGRYGVLLSYLSARQGPVRLLDFGCGVGILRERIGHIDIAEYVGIDPSAQAIATARENQTPKERFEVAELPDPSLGLFDAIVCNEVLYYIEDLPAALKRLRASLAPGGWLLTSVMRHPGDIAIHRALEAEFELLDSVLVKRRTPPRNGWVVSCYAAPQDSGT